MNVKYAYLVFDPPFPFPQNINFQFDPQTRVQSGNLKNYVNQPGWNHWKEWLGTITWDQISGSSKIVLSTWMNSTTAEVIDQENQVLEGRLQTLFRILPLVAAFRPPHEDAYVFSGLGQIVNNNLVAIDQRTFSRIRPWTQALYAGSSMNAFFTWGQPILTSQQRLDDWKACEQEFNSHVLGTNTRRQLVEAWRSFEEAVRGSQLEFKIPNLVRAIECLIDCWGKRQFAQRVLHLTGALPATLPFGISTNTVDLLENLYELRNDCSHGKPFAYSLQKKLGTAPNAQLIATYEFLAEWVARDLILATFKSPSLLAASVDRDTLVNAWAATPLPTK